MLHKVKAGKLEGMELKVYLQSNQVKRTPQDCINELIIWNLNPLSFQECNNELIIRILNSLVRSKNTANGFRFRKSNSLLHSWKD